MGIFYFIEQQNPGILLSTFVSNCDNCNYNLKTELFVCL